MGALCKDYTTHLICLDNKSEKYNAVKSWQSSSIVCVSYKWLLDCLTAWRKVDERKYIIGSEEGDDVSTEEDEEEEEVDENSMEEGFSMNPEESKRSKDEDEALQGVSKCPM